MNILLTGASRGIGYQTALELCKMDIKHLVLVSRTEEKLTELKKECLRINPDINVTIISGDIIDLVSGEKDIFKYIPFNNLNVLINNAGTLMNKPFQEYTMQDSRQIFDINFHAPAQLIKLFVPLLNKSNNSHVVNISSMGGFQGSSKYPGLSYYSASKAALASLTECLASEFSESNVRFNCLALGAVQTEMLGEAFPGYIAPVAANEMGKYIARFALNDYKYYNGQILPVRLGNP